MKKAWLVVFLGLGLVALSACTSNWSMRSEGEDKEQAGMNIAPTVSTEVEVEAGNAETQAIALVDGSYQVDVANSKLTWQAAKIVGSGHAGTAPIKSGFLRVAGGSLVGGEFVLDVSALESDEDIDGLEKHLKSADFFDVETYPEAKLVITSVQADGATGKYNVTADLTIKGITAPINFQAELSQTDTQLLAATAFSVDRTIWGLQYNSGKFFQDLGDKAIKDDITFGVSLSANR